jgi:predicted SnoaL-like aldol condensation-catalyzing enzyme
MPRPDYDATTRDTLAAVDRFNAAFNRRDVDAVMAAMTEDCVFEFWEEFFRRSPQARFETEEVIGAGDRCVVRWVYHWVREGSPGHVRGVDLFRVRDGKVAEKLSYVKG